MTEEEAKTKRCCGPSGCGFTSGAENHIAYHDGSTGELVAAVVPIRWCIGSACMAWRWNGHVDRATGRLLQGLTDIECSESDDHVAAVGYCGLAGKP